MLTPDSRAWVLGEVTTFGDEWLKGKQKEGTRNSPPPYWEPRSSQTELIIPYDSHSAGLILEGLKPARTDFNYAKLADIEQEEKKTLGKFPDRLREALSKFTDIDLEITEWEMILKDRFLTQLAPDICWKLQKQEFGPN